MIKTPWMLIIGTITVVWGWISPDEFVWGMATTSAIAHFLYEYRS